MSSTSNSLKFLIADRDPEVSRTLRENLVGMGHRVTVVETGEEAFNEIQTGQYQAAILDVVMPDKDGYDILKWIREDDTLKSMWVGLTSEMAARFRKGTGLPHQPDAWVSKPVDPQELTTWLLPTP